MEALQKPVIEEAIVADQSTTTTDSRTEEESVGNIEEEDEVSFLDVDLLIEHGIAVEDVRKLQKFGINTIKGKLYDYLAKIMLMVVCLLDVN